MPLRQPTATIAPKPKQMMLTNPPPTATAKTTPILTATIATTTPSPTLSPATQTPLTTSPILQDPSPLRNLKATQSRLRPTSSRRLDHQQPPHLPPLPSPKQHPDCRRSHHNAHGIATPLLTTYQPRTQANPAATVNDGPKPPAPPTNRLRRFPSQRLTSNSTTPRCRHRIHLAPPVHQPAHPQYHPQDTAKATPSERSRSDAPMTQPNRNVIN